MSVTRQWDESGPDPHEETTRVLLCDREPLFREGLRAVLAGTEGLQVVGDVGDGFGAVAMAGLLKASLVVMSMPAVDIRSLNCIRELTEAGDPVAVLVLSTLDDDRNLVEALRAGAKGFLHKEAGPEEVVQAIRAIAAGDAALGAPAARRVLELLRDLPRVSPPPSPALASLTRREREMLGLIARGWSNERIARELSLGRATVKSHVYHLSQKLNAADRAQVVVFAYEHGVVEPGSGETVFNY